MSKFKLVAIVVGFIFFCPLLTNAQESCDGVVPLYAGQTIHVGDVLVSYTSDGEGPGLQVTYNMFAGWQLTETHVAVSLEPPESDSFFAKMITKSGNPVPGRFPWKKEYAVSLSTADLYIDATGFPDSIYIAAHAVVTNSDGEIETAWADGENFLGDNWATYFDYLLEDCSGGGETPPDGDTQPDGEIPLEEEPS